MGFFLWFNIILKFSFLKINKWLYVGSSKTKIKRKISMLKILKVYLRLFTFGLQLRLSPLIIMTIENLVSSFLSKLIESERSVQYCFSASLVLFSFNNSLLKVSPSLNSLGTKCICIIKRNILPT